MLVGLLLGLLAGPVMAETIVLLGDGQMDGFASETLPEIARHTEYAWVSDADAGEDKVLDAQADAAAAALLRQRKIPFSSDAVLEVTYKVIEASNQADERSKAGDDFPLRLYLISNGLLLYKTLVLVHSLQNATGVQWRNPYSSVIAEFQMHVFAGSDVPLGKWHTVEIEVGKVWHQVFGTEVDEMDAFSIMVDSDNGGGRMHTRISRVVYRS